MIQLIEAGVGNNTYKYLEPGLYKVTVEISNGNAASVGFTVKDREAGEDRAVLDPAGAAYAFTADGGEFTYISSSQFLKAVITGGTASGVYVRAQRQ